MSTGDLMEDWNNPIITHMAEVKVTNAPQMLNRERRDNPRFEPDLITVYWVWDADNHEGWLRKSYSVSGFMISKNTAKALTLRTSIGPRGKTATPTWAMDIIEKTCPDYTPYQ